MSTLSCDVFVSDGVPRVTDLRMPDGSGLVSSPVSSTLTCGERDAVLADPSWTVAQTEALGDWIERSGKQLAYIYVTHGHGDHWFGTAQLLERFPAQPCTPPKAPSARCTSRPAPARTSGTRSSPD